MRKHAYWVSTFPGLAKLKSLLEQDIGTVPQYFVRAIHSCYSFIFET